MNKLVILFSKRKVLWTIICILLFLTVFLVLDWINTGIEITKGDVIEISAEGKFVWKREGRELCGPDGADVYSYSANKPMPGAPTGAMIARIGTDSKESVLIGSHKTIVAFKSGSLYLGINDDNTKDNDGEYRVWIKKQ